MHEIEFKFRANPDIFKRLQALYSFGKPERILDTYYTPPGRDPRNTDEWLRTRTIHPCDSPDSTQYITYKGPSDNHHSEGVREEIEVKCEGSVTALMARLKMPTVCHVYKIRRTAEIPLNYDPNHVAKICLDDVKNIGMFVEFEIVNDGYEDLAIQFLLGLAHNLGIANIEKRNYAKLALELQATEKLL